MSETAMASPLITNIADIVTASQSAAAPEDFDSGLSHLISACSAAPHSIRVANFPRAVGPLRLG